MARILLAISTYFASLLSAGSALADTSITLTDPICGGSPNCGFTTIAQKIIDFIFTISVPLVAILVLWGGFQMITAAGDPEKFSAGKKTILYAAIGFAVVLLANGVVDLIRSLIGVQ